MSIIVGSRQVFPFDMIARLAHRQAGEAMLLEAYKQRAKIQELSLSFSSYASDSVPLLKDGD